MEVYPHELMVGDMIAPAPSRIYEKIVRIEQCQQGCHYQIYTEIDEESPILFSKADKIKKQDGPRRPLEEKDARIADLLTVLEAIRQEASEAMASGDSETIETVENIYLLATGMLPQKG